MELKEPWSGWCCCLRYIDSRCIMLWLELNCGEFNIYLLLMSLLLCTPFNNFTAKLHTILRHHQDIWETAKRLHCQVHILGNTPSPIHKGSYYAENCTINLLSRLVPHTFRPCTGTNGTYSHIGTHISICSMSVRTKQNTIVADPCIKMRVLPHSYKAGVGTWGPFVALSGPPILPTGNSQFPIFYCPHIASEQLIEM